MIECVFTIDYEIYGNGEGALTELIYDPARKLKKAFDQAGSKLVLFVEAAELEKIAAAGSDPAIGEVERQIAEFHQDGFEIALHLHPQWYNARHRDGSWELDYSEYNLCRLPKDRIEEIVDRSTAYLRSVVASPQFSPLSFRAGNWLFQPTGTVAEVLSERGIRVDSSVFKGGLLHRHNVDYRPSLGNGYFWRFQRDVNQSDVDGAMLEIPIYTRMVPCWRMLTTKRLNLQRNAKVLPRKLSRQDASGMMGRLRDQLRFRYPLKFDFCRMTLQELNDMIEAVIRDDRRTPGVFKPLVAIGHTKDLIDFETVHALLGFLKERNIQVSTFQDIYNRCLQQVGNCENVLPPPPIHVAG